jgi:hypothetical protein
MSSLKAGDLIFYIDTADHYSYPPSDSAASPLFYGIYLREATGAECTAAGVEAPTSYVTRVNGDHFSLATLASTDTGEVPLLISDAVIVGAVHTGIDADLLLPI